MEPGLRSGDWLLVTSLGGPYRVGDIVLAADPRVPDRLVLKRIAAIHDGRCTLLGDQPEQSTDSREFGPVPLAEIRGRAIFRYAPIGRFGPL
jgi:signal peptidase I